mmetsp:Transcript_10174/g.28775  ORF Transcript_10174/g.28775 Transcript_10174/m.28775 type:complete len:180 (-) Transcript_10174:1590-2129(-)
MSVWVDRAALEPGDTPVIGISLTPRVTLRTDHDPNANTSTTLSRNGHGNLASAGMSANGLTNYKKIDADQYREAGDGVELKSGEVALRSRWYRCLGGRTGAFCSYHPDLEATVQCLSCVKVRIGATAVLLGRKEGAHSRRGRAPARVLSDKPCFSLPSAPPWSTETGGRVLACCGETEN